MGESPPILALAGGGTAFGAVRALEDACSESWGGGLHAPAGENGVGKSTVVKILAGALRPDEGRVSSDGRPVGFTRPGDARQAGITVIHREPALFRGLSWRDAIAGVLLLVAISVDRLLGLRVTRALRRRDGRHGV